VQLFWHNIGLLLYNMKKLLLAAFLMTSLFSFGQKASFEKRGQQFDNIIEGEVLKFNYYFTNTGSSDLILKSVKPTCGCTIADYPKGAIKPGQRDSIQVTFDTKGRAGYNAKGVNIMTNAGEVQLVFEVQVVASATPKLEGKD
jgi:hypothetical protein